MKNRLAEKVDLVYAQTMQEALESAQNDYEPVECSFGKESVVGALILDHHGKYSHEEAVSLKAARLSLAGERRYKFVVTGTADCDQCYAIAALAGLVPVNKDLEEASAIAEIDTDPVGRDKTNDRYIRILMFEQNTQGLKKCLKGSYFALGELKKIFNGRYGLDEITRAMDKEERRKDEALAKIKHSMKGIIALTSSNVRSFDVWYHTAPIIINYDPVNYTITIGLCPKKGELLCDQSGFDLLGPDGLNSVIPDLDRDIMQGFGGRDVIIGSPRNARMSFGDAEKAYKSVRNRIIRWSAGKA